LGAPYMLSLGMGMLGQVPVAHTCNPSYLLEAEIGRIVVRGQPEQIFMRPPSPE
jgi:hypothetical protein